MNPITAEEVDIITNTTLDIGATDNYKVYAELLAARNGDILITTEHSGGVCYADVLAQYRPKHHEVILAPKYIAWPSFSRASFTMPPEVIKEFFDMLFYVHIFDKKFVSIEYNEFGHPEVTIAAGIDYISAYIIMTFYRCAESYAPSAYLLLELYKLAKKRGIKFFQCMMFVGYTHRLGSENFFLPQRLVLGCPSYGNAWWAMLKQSRELRDKNLEYRDKGLVHAYLTKLHTALSPKGIWAVLNIIDIMHPYFGPIFTNSKLSPDVYDVLMQQAPVETHFISSTSQDLAPLYNL